eukprot:CAMPEP_0114672518 /NCGR_PEP_ID=MMETSP0191-20121206/43060_1 /TAXON_ID=126664 /ORGANISM="Sorites sp." /LENGTH=244 /DNA_ID=CAMNT_0001935085 /DNA_START=1271 /DNA_END=2002 /DNA_ORIENTATION=+
MTGCATDQAPMALREYGAGNNGTLEFWDQVSKKYASNPLVFYELYNEPYLKKGEFDTYYAGDDTYVGMKEMYDVVRKNDPNGLIIIAGMQSYTFDSATQIALWLKYYQDTGKYLKNVLFNFHPYQGNSQGTEKAVAPALRLLLSSKTIAPVIMTEFGQYCCGANVQTCPGNPNLICNDHNTGDHFSFNMVNMAAQYDISWTAWAWWGASGYQCSAIRKCNDLRNEDGSYVSNGTYGGAPWITIW